MKRSVLVGVMALLMALVPATTATSEAQLSVKFLSVGQSDAVLYEGPCGELGLIDAGAGDDDYVLAELDRRGSRALEWMSVSHYDADHVGDVADPAHRPSSVSLITRVDHRTNREWADLGTATASSRVVTERSCSFAGLIRALARPSCELTA